MESAFADSLSILVRVLRSLLSGDANCRQLVSDSHRFVPRSWTIVADAIDNVLGRSARVRSD